ncbi:L-threonylcarbamoyladenylate synthase [Bacillaceae bacterium IKA-2]|nr:L-threonylcarbamoyladenylate synthase [Bacillaceae bacterium IKA-2]
MNTKIWTVAKINDINAIYPQIKEAALLIANNQVVAFPTETVYGLGANAYSEEAVAKIFIAKGRPSDNPLIVHIAEKRQLKQLVKEVPAHASKLIEAFWPGPLTLVLEKGVGIAEKVTAGLATVAVRMPDHPVALALIKAAQVPVAAPSANVSGKPSPTLADHVYEDLFGKISGIVDSGATGVGVESTVVDCTAEVPIILRPGGITREQIEEVVGVVTVDPALEENDQVPKSPGLKYKHYAPVARLILVNGSHQFLQQQVARAKQQGKKVGVLTTFEGLGDYQADLVLPCGTNSKISTTAHHLYGVLRKFDQFDLDVIYSEVFPEAGVGKAIMNRLIKAANGDVISES